ncbi:MAG TPA: hypothetical protein VFG30_09890 [Polyangiales bacterium]|nr:hypothetical protein [Polyangiales bacterium]
MQHLGVVCRCVVALHAILVLGVGSARAQTSTASEPAPAVLNVQGPSGCVDTNAIEAQVRERSHRIVFVPASSDVPVLNVGVSRPAVRSVTIELTISWPDKRRSRRKLAADSCGEATSAVAFLIALTLDPAAFAQPSSSAGAADTSGSPAQPPPPPSAAGGPAGEAGSGSGASAIPAPASAEKTTPGSSDEATPGDEDSTEASTPVFAFEHLGFSVGAQVASGVSPSLMPGLTAGVLLAFRGRGIFVPALQLSAAHVWVSDLAQAGGVAAFQLTTVRLDVCPLGVRAGALGARACLTAAVGSLNAQGANSYLPRTSARGWLDLGARLLASIDIGAVFQVLGGVGLVAPLRRDRFAFRPEVFHRVDVPCWEGHLGLGVRFP